MTDFCPRILVVEDEERMRHFIGALLESHDFTFLAAGTGKEGLRLATEYNPEVILLDLGLPDQDGLEVLKSLRTWSDIPIIVLSVRDREQDKVTALDEGADDYLTKPFSSRELLARIRVALRHLAQRDGDSDADQQWFELGQLRICLARREIFLDQEPVELTPTEFRLLQTMVRHVGKVLTYRFLLQQVWGPAYVERSHYVRIYMARLREKLGDDPTRQRYIVTETGVGYRLRDHLS